MNQPPPSIEVRRIEAESPPFWTGDLYDDCTARWAGFLLRAEEMEKGIWWYAVSDIAAGFTVESSNDTAAIVHDGAAARQKCEDAVREFLSIPIK